jgi:hypothetical protein
MQISNQSSLRDLVKGALMVSAVGIVYLAASGCGDMPMPTGSGSISDYEANRSENRSEPYKGKPHESSVYKPSEEDLGQLEQGADVKAEFSPAGSENPPVSITCPASNGGACNNSTAINSATQNKLNTNLNENLTMVAAPSAVDASTDAARDAAGAAVDSSIQDLNSGGSAADMIDMPMPGNDFIDNSDFPN